MYTYGQNFSAVNVFRALQCTLVVDCVSYSEVVPEQLHDESTVLVRVLLQLVQLSNSSVKCLNNNTLRCKLCCCIQL